MARDPKAIAQERFRTADCCLSNAEVIERYATDVEEINATLVDAVRPERPDARICELGFGLGWLLEEMAKAYPEAALFGLDLSAGMTSHVRGLLGSRAAIVQGDMERLPFPDGAFDVVVTCWTLYFMRDIDATLGEIKRTLRPGGKLVAATVASDAGYEIDRLWYEAVSVATGQRDEFDGTRRFNLETGSAMVRRHFLRVEQREWRGWLTLPDVPTLVRFAELSRPVLPEGIAEQVRLEMTRLTEIWLAEAGELRVTRHGGAFVGYA